MNEIKCPHCGKIFTVDEESYSNIQQQIRNNEFEKELHLRLEEINSRHNLELENEKTKLESILKEENSRVLNIKEKEILELQSKLSSFDVNKNIEKKEIEENFSNKLIQKDKEIQELKNQVSNFEMQKSFEKQELEMKYTNLINGKEKIISEMNTKLTLVEKENELEKKSIKDRYEIELKQKDETIEYYKDFKAKQSTKMIGESLEQHCEISFNRLRPVAFPNAIFGKDNDASSGSKGDYIYREFDEDGVEIISIMFEMKNEADTTSTKKKNENFFKELDKDRNEKNCEYAILVSLLEAESELYNDGIVDVSYQYPKMYVIRPQFFIPIISMLRNAALNSLKYKKEVAMIKEQNIDITNFEEDLNNFKMAFSKNYELASKKFKTAIDEIDKTISHLQKVKDALVSSETNLRIANNKAEDITIKKLTRKNPTMKLKFEELKK
ncbi:DUF2130 domain-containing protein [Pseudostreptobacillus hongkongensis]|uniref:DUF2130 domain-containing protein n=1 Tax=Pseudostreptobacillus hongkongensis TaxID=1162717 RepID=UPI0028D7D6D1|nr:DUF2130 domain-containing protein [Pseudostreptobacillus hongkongensis]